MDGWHKIFRGSGWGSSPSIPAARTGSLRDETGAVRLWPVECAVGWNPGRQIDCSAISKIRDQLWAEAVVRYDRGEKWWLDDKELRVAQEELADERQEDEPREARVRELIKGELWVQMHDLLLQLGYATAEQDRRLQTEVGYIV